MTRCAVLECKNYSGNKNLSISGVSFHRFPKDPHVKEKWITATGRINWMPTKSSCICSEHFAENDIIITKKGLRHIHPNAFPTKKIMSYQDEKMTSPSSKRVNILEEPEPSSEPPTKKPCIRMDQSQKDLFKPADNKTTKSTGASSAIKSSSSSLDSCPRQKKLSGMLRWTRSTIIKKDLKIKRLQAQNRRLKRRLKNMEQLLKTL